MLEASGALRRKSGRLNVVAGKVYRSDWTLIVDYRKRLLTSGHELGEYLAKLVAGGVNELSLSKNQARADGFEGWLYRVLGLKTSTQEMGVWLLAQGPHVLLTFLDEDFNEKRASDPERHRSSDTSERVRFESKHGTGETVSVGECVSRESAARAVREFFEESSFPLWLQYEDVPSGKRKLGRQRD